MFGKFFKKREDNSIEISGIVVQGVFNLEAGARVFAIIRNGMLLGLTSKGISLTTNDGFLIGAEVYELGLYNGKGGLIQNQFKTGMPIQEQKNDK